MRRMLAAACAAVLAGFSGVAEAAEKLRFGPADAWIKPADLPASSPAQARSAVQVLLADSHTRFRAGAFDHYAEQAIQIQSPQGLAALGGLTVVWDPETEVVTVHKAHVVRGGRVIDMLAAGQTFTVLRREQNLEASMLDGQLTATLQPEGLQVGDVIRVAYTLTRTDSVLGAHSEQLASVLSPLPTRRLRYRALWPAEKALKWRATDGVAPPKLSAVGSETELVVEMTDATAPEPPALAPGRFAEVGQLDPGRVPRSVEPRGGRAPPGPRPRPLCVSGHEQRRLCARRRG